MNKDVETIKRTYDLVVEVERELGPPPSRSGSIRRWHCPFHPGDDNPSFTVYPDGHFHCYGCSEHGDVITWTMKRRGIGFNQACSELGAQRKGLKGRESLQSEARREARIETAEPDSSNTLVVPLPSTPSEAWQEAAMKVVVDCECELWAGSSPTGEQARAYLAKRGLGETVLRDYCIGCNSVERQVALPSSSGGEVKLWVPTGITIPLWHEDTNTLYGINVRLSREARSAWKNAPGRDAKYLLATGSRRAPVGLGTLAGKSHAFVLEGEFDTLLTIQTLRTMGAAAAHAGAFTMGSASSQDVERWLLPHPELLSPRRFLIATDGDSPGQQAASRWLEITDRARRWPPPTPCKDITDLWRKHGNEGVRLWIEIGLKQHP